MRFSQCHPKRPFGNHLPDGIAGVGAEVSALSRLPYWHEREAPSPNVGSGPMLPPRRESIAFGTEQTTHQLWPIDGCFRMSITKTERQRSDAKLASLMRLTSLRIDGLLAGSDSGDNEARKELAAFCRSDSVGPRERQMVGSAYQTGVDDLLQRRLEVHALVNDVRPFAMANWICRRLGEYKGDISFAEELVCLVNEGIEALAMNGDGGAISLGFALYAARREKPRGSGAPQEDGQSGTAGRSEVKGEYSYPIVLNTFLSAFGPYLHAKARKMYPYPEDPRRDWEDLEAAGRMGLMQALDTFAPRKGLSFWRYVVARGNRVHGEMVHEINRLRGNSDRLSRLYKIVKSVREELRVSGEGEPSFQSTAAMITRRIEAGFYDGENQMAGVKEVTTEQVAALLSQKEELEEEALGDPLVGEGHTASAIEADELREDGPLLERIYRQLDTKGGKWGAVLRMTRVEKKSAKRITACLGLSYGYVRRVRSWDHAPLVADWMFQQMLAFAGQGQKETAIESWHERALRLHCEVRRSALDGLDRAIYHCLAQLQPAWRATMACYHAMDGISARDRYAAVAEKTGSRTDKVRQVVTAASKVRGYAYVCLYGDGSRSEVSCESHAVREAVAFGLREWGKRGGADT